MSPSVTTDRVAECHPSAVGQNASAKTRGFRRPDGNSSQTSDATTTGFPASRPPRDPRLAVEGRAAHDLDAGPHGCHNDVVHSPWSRTPTGRQDQ